MTLKSGAALATRARVLQGGSGDCPARRGARGQGVLVAVMVLAWKSSTAEQRDDVRGQWLALLGESLPW